VNTITRPVHLGVVGVGSHYSARGSQRRVDLRLCGRRVLVGKTHRVTQTERIAEALPAKSVALEDRVRIAQCRATTRSHRGYSSAQVCKQPRIDVFLRIVSGLNDGIGVVAFEGV